MHTTGATITFINDTTVDSNTAADEGGGLWASAIGTMTVTNTTVSNNNAGDGGGLFLAGAGNGLLSTSNTTVSGNSAINGGGVQVEGATFSFASTTIANNTASGTGGGINKVGGIVNSSNNIIGDNMASMSNDYNGSFDFADFTVLEDSIGVTGGISHKVAGSIVGFDPELRPLTDNGGPTQTHEPEGLSPALDRGNATELLDQRGLQRNEGQVDDMGAFEVQFGQLPNDLCENAFMPFECGDFLFGTTGTATDIGAPPGCDFNNGSGQPGAWLKLEGTGSRVVITTDFPCTNFDTEINVYSGSCGGLTCIGGDDDGGIKPGTSRFGFDTNVGVTYFVYVTGEGGSRGQFQIGYDARLVIVCREPVNTHNDPGLCGAVVELIPPEVIEGGCLLGSLTSDAPAFFPVGTTVVTWTATPADPTSGVETVTCTQNVTINDAEAPVIDCPQSITLFTSWDNCGYPASILSLPTATDNCMVASIVADPDNLDFYGPGQFMRNYTATDGAGNQSTCMQWVKVFDTTSPLVQECPENITVDATSSNGANVTWVASAIDNCPGPIIENSAFNSGDLFPLGSTDVLIEFYDQYGNSVDCEFTVTVQVDDPNTAIVAGMVTNEDIEPLENVEVQINGGDIFNDVYLTASDGLYNFNAPLGGDYSITPMNDNNLLNGITTFDLVLIKKHILGISPLDSPYEMIAADIDNSGSISTLDLVHLKKAILFITDYFPNNTSWRFIDAAYQFPNATNPFAEAFPEIISINNLPAPINDADFIGVKIGDVSGSASTSGLLAADDRTMGQPLALSTKNTAMKAGETYTMDFTAADFHQFGFQFTLNFDTDKVDFEDIESDLVNFGLNQLEEGAITANWFDAEAQEIEATTSIFSLTLTAKADVNIADALTLNSRFTPAEAYHANGDFQDVVLDFANEVGAAFKLYQNTPNPFATATTIGFDLPSNDAVTISVSDASGKLFFIQQMDGSKGFNKIELTRAELPTSGTLYYTVTTSETTATNKMILID